MSFQKQLSAAKQTMLAALSAAQEDYAAELSDIGAMRCEAQLRTSTQLDAVLETPHVSKEGLMACKQHGYHVYSTAAFRKLVGARRETFANRHKRVIASLGNEAKAQLGSEIEQAAANIARKDVHGYIDARQIFVNERKQRALFEKVTSAGVNLELLEEFYRCYRKQAHPTPASAQLHVDRLIAAQDSIGGVLKTYQCHYCTGWHVGHVSSDATVYSMDSALRTISFLRAYNPAAREFCVEKGLPLSVLR